MKIYSKLRGPYHDMTTMSGAVAGTPEGSLFCYTQTNMNQWFMEKTRLNQSACSVLGTSFAFVGRDRGNLPQLTRVDPIVVPRARSTRRYEEAFLSSE